MSLDLQEVDLTRFDLPKTKDDTRGIDRLFLQKLLNLNYTVNDLWSLRHKVDQRANADIGSGGSAFTAPTGARRLVFDFLFNYVATATAGTRSVVLDRRDKPGDVINRMVARTLTAGVGETYQIGPLASGSRSVNIQISMPLVLEPEWTLTIDDANNIDNLDDVGWTIDYLEIPI